MLLAENIICKIWIPPLTHPGKYENNFCFHLFCDFQNALAYRIHILSNGTAERCRRQRKSALARKQRKGNPRDTDRDVTVTASNGESAKKVKHRECQTSHKSNNLAWACDPIESQYLGAVNFKKTRDLDKLYIWVRDMVTWYCLADTLAGVWMPCWATSSSSSSCLRAHEQFG